nr:hypothetical protein TSUD_235110 [Ipomoea batatas]
MLRANPKIPRNQFTHHIGVYLLGVFIIIHIKQGYAKVTGSAIPPISPARLGKNGSATAMKNASPPKKRRSATLSHHGHGLFFLLVYLNSRLSNTGIAYIWKEIMSPESESYDAKSVENVANPPDRGIDFHGIIRHVGGAMFDDGHRPCDGAVGDGGDGSHQRHSGDGVEVGKLS